MSYELAVEVAKAGTLLLLGTVGEIFAERSGVLNLGIEGIMAASAAVAYAVAISFENPPLALFAACLLGVALSLVHALATVSMRANQVVSGLAITMIGIGIGMSIGGVYVGKPLRAGLPPGPFIYLALAMAVASWLVLNKTRIGLMVRSIGDEPAAADAAGINVTLVRYACVCFGGFMTGLAGAFLSLAYIPLWAEKLTTEGRGWIVIALVIFSAWSPVRAILGAYLFGCAEALTFSLQRFGMNPYLLNMLPYGVTIFVMLVSSSEAMRKRLGAPAALGKPYVREEKLI